MNGTETVTLKAGGKAYQVQFLGAADLPPRAGEFRIRPQGEGEAQQVQVKLDLEFLWSADAAMNETEVLEQIMRSVGLKCIEAYLAGKLGKDKDGTLSTREFIGRRYPDYTSVERFIGSLYDAPGRLTKMCREDVLKILFAAAEDEKQKAGLSVWGILTSSAKRRFYNADLIHDAIMFWESRGLVETVAEKARIRDDSVEQVRSLIGG